jgi:thioredoxin 1
MEEVASEGYSVQFIDVDESQNLATQYRVTSVPTVVIEVNGTTVDRFIGAIPKSQILERLM